jgi:hypothetical protein
MQQEAVTIAVEQFEAEKTAWEIDPLIVSAAY